MRYEYFLAIIVVIGCVYGCDRATTSQQPDTEFQKNTRAFLTEAKRAESLLKMGASTEERNKQLVEVRRLAAGLDDTDNSERQLQQTAATLTDSLIRASANFDRKIEQQRFAKKIAKFQEGPDMPQDIPKLNVQADVDRAETTYKKSLDEVNRLISIIANGKGK